MTHKERLENPLYKNWIRGALGLGYVHDGLYGFVNEQSAKQQQELVTKVFSVNCSSARNTPNDCTQCTLENLLPNHARLGKSCIQMTKSKCMCSSKLGRRLCPNGICSYMYDLIVEQHVYRDPLWKNTHPALWYTEHWSIAKCFHTSLCQSTSAKSTDTSGLLSIILNNVFIQKELSSNDPYTRAREVRNEILHCPTLELTETVLKEFIDVFIALLSDTKAFHNDEAAIKAVKNLKELKICPIYISLKDELQLRNDAMQALEEKRAEAVSEIETAQNKALGLIQRHIDSKTGSETEDKIQVEKTQGQLKLMSTQLTKIRSSQIIGERKQHQTEDRLKRTETGQSEIMEKICQNQETIKKQIELIENRQLIEERCNRQLALQMKELQQKIDNIASSDTSLQIAKEGHQRYTQILERKIDLQTELITLYQQYYLKTDVSPLLPEEDINVDEIYVPLMMERVYKHDQRIFNKGEPVYFYEDIFFQDENRRFRNIFITADAGIGKTTFCRKLTSTWCKVHSQQRKDDIISIKSNRTKFRTKENIESRDRETLRRFTYLFYISLRHTNKERTIEDMICSQLLSENSKDLLIAILNDHPDSCLILLDGLDEWETSLQLPKSPFITSGLPEKNVKKPYTTLFTTRPWKLEKIRPKTGEVDVEIKLIGLHSTDAKKLAKTVIEKLNDSSYTPVNDVENFIKCLDLKHFQNLESVPILLKLLACLWHEQMDISSSLCGVYSSVLEQIIRIARERNSHDEQFERTLKKLQTSEGQSQTVLDVFQCKNNCLTLVQFLKILSKFAFNALFGVGGKANLVFEDSALESFGISDEEMQFSLKTGILSQRLLLGRSVINRCKSVTFIHKTFQEYFAALHVVISDDIGAIDILLKVCSNIEKVLEMGKVIQFIGGMNPKLLYRISKHIAILTDGDTRFTMYRSLDTSRIYILMIQDLLFSSVKESIECHHTGLPRFHLRDVHLWDQESNKYVLNFDPQHVESLSTNSGITDAELSHISKTKHLKLLCFSGLFGKFPRKEFLNILERSSSTLVCLVVKTGNIEIPKHFHQSKLQNLSKILLNDVTLSHSSMTKLLTDSTHLSECHALCVSSFYDEMCQCNSIQSNEASTLNLASTEMEHFESRFGCGLLRHISKADRLKELRVFNSKDPEIVNDIIRIIRSCKRLKIMQLHGIDSEILRLPFPKDSQDLHSVQFSEIRARKETILTFIKAGQNVNESCIFEFENITLTAGHTEDLVEEIEQLNLFRIKSFKKCFKVRGAFRRPKYRTSFGTEAVISMVLAKNPGNC